MIPLLSMFGHRREGRAEPGDRVPKLARVLTALFVATIALLALAPGTATAENTVVNSSPEDGTSVGVPPEAIVIGFAEELGDENTISLDCEAEPVTLPGPEVVEETTLQVDITEPLPSGTCTVRWFVSNPAGEPNGRGVITFVVENANPEGGVDPAVAAPEPSGTAATAVPSTADDASGDGADGASASSSDDPEVVDFSTAGDGNAGVWLSRFVSTLAIAVLFGSLVTITAAWPEGVEYLVTVRFLRATWVVAIAATVVFTAFAADAVTPDGGGGAFSPATWFDLFDAGWSGRAVLARLVLLILAAWPAFRPERVIDPTTQLAALGIPTLCAVTLGLSRTVGDLAGLNVAMSILHALAMSVWVGGVVLIARVVVSGPGDEDLIYAVRGFGRISTAAIVVTIATGLVQMFILDGGELFQSGHGRVLLLKTVVVAFMIFIAFSARQFVSQRLNRAQQMSVPLADRLRRAFGVEAGIGVVVLGLSAWLLAFTPPNVTVESSVVYEVTQNHTDESGNLDVVVRLTDSQIGLVGLEVEVILPEEGLSGLSVVFTAPPDNDQNIGAIRQPVPLDGPGFAVRDESIGLPISVPGDWTIQVSASVDGTAVSSTPQIWPVSDQTAETGSTGVTVPATVTSTEPATTASATTGG